METGYNPAAPSTPPSEASSPTSLGFVPEHDLDDEELEGDTEDGSEPWQEGKVEPRKGGYSSRIEQTLYEHPDLDIQIVAAGKNTEGGGGYITYTIRTGVCREADGEEWPILTSSDAGRRSAKTILRVRVTAQDAGRPPPDSHHPAHSGEALDQRLRREADKGQGGRGHHRTATAHVVYFPQQMSQDG